MSEQKSFRKPYNPPIDRLWWTKNPFFFRYIARECTAFAALFVALELMLGVLMFCISSTDGQATAMTAAPYLWFVKSFLGNPLILLINIGALAATGFHAFTWFNLMPKAVRVFMNKESTELLPEKFVVIALYAALAATSVIVLIAALASK